MAYVPKYKHDLFLSYARAESEWVDTFRVALAQALHSLIGRAPSIWQDVRNIRFGQDWSDEIQKGISEAAAFLAVCSPSYFHSEWCAREYDAFAPKGSLEGLKVGSFYRFLKLIKTPDPDQIHTRFYKDLQPIQFFNKAEEEYLLGSREFMFEVGRAAKAIFELLRQMRNSKQALYVATAAPSLSKERQQLRDQLLDYGYDVRPTVVLTPAIKGLAEEEIERSTLAIFLLDGAEDAFVKCQLDAARDRKRHIIVWVHPRAGESKKNEILAAILQDAPAAQVLGGNSIREFIQDLFELLSPKTDHAPAAAKTGRSVYLMHDSNQQREVEGADFLRNLIRQQRLNVIPDTRVSFSPEAHERFMQECDGLLLYRGQMMEGPDNWLFQNIPEVQFAERKYQLRIPLKAKTLLLADPSQVAGVPGLDVLSYRESITTDLLQPFFSKMREPGQPHVAN